MSSSSRISHLESPVVVEEARRNGWYEDMIPCSGGSGSDEIGNG